MNKTKERIRELQVSIAHLGHSMTNIGKKAKIWKELREIEEEQEEEDIQPNKSQEEEIYMADGTKGNVVTTNDEDEESKVDEGLMIETASVGYSISRDYSKATNLKLHRLIRN